MTLRQRAKLALLMAKISWKHVSTRPGYFRYRGLRVFHAGVLLDQPACATAIESAIESARVAGAPFADSLSVLRRCSLRFVKPEALPKGVMAQATWNGGFLDRGLIKLVLHDNWVSDLQSSVLKMILSEAKAAEARNGVEVPT